MNSRKEKQSGVILPMMAILIVVLLGMVGLALDYGRMTVWKNRLQNAVDGAALAAAAELNGRDGALDRARAAAREMLEPHDIDLETEIDHITFYETLDAEANGQVTDSDRDAHYVKVRITEWPVTLIFMPVLNAVLPGDPAATRDLQVGALAGRHFFACNYPPMMMCNPFEPAGKSLREAVDEGDLKPGDMLILKYQSGTWSPGNFAFLQPSDEDGNVATGAKSLGEYIADPSRQGCTPSTVRTRTGSVQSWPIWGWNTRFDLYKGFSAAEYPPAPDVMEYPQDESFRTIGGISDRFGNGDWPREAYWERYHEPQGHSQPSGYSAMSRWEVYNHELASGHFPCDPDGPDGESGTTDDIVCPDQVDLENKAYDDPAPTPERPDDVLDGLADPDHLAFDSEPASVPKRRVLFLASIDCQAQGVSGASDAEAETFAKFFILQRGKQGAGGDGIDFVVEFMGLASEQDEEYHVDVQLYE